MTKLWLRLLIALGSLLPASALADTLPPVINPPNSGGSVGQNANAQAIFVNVYSKAMRTLLIGGAILAVIFIIWNGLRMIQAAGSADKIKMARSNIINIVIGVIVVGLALTIFRIAQVIGGEISKLG